MKTTRTTSTRTTVATGRTQTNRAGKVSHNTPAIKDLVVKVRKLQLQEANARADVIRCHIEIGEHLQTLQDQTEHGEWIKRLQELGYGERQAQRLKKVANSRLAGQIRPTVTDLGRRLPADLQKLVALTRLSLEQLQELLNDVCLDLNDMSRDEISQRVKELLGGDEGKGLADSSAHFSSLHRNTEVAVPAEYRPHPDITPSENASAGGVQAGPVSLNGQAGGNFADRDQDHQRRVQSLHRIASGPRREDRPLKIAVEKAYPAFEAEVIRLASAFGREAGNEATRALGHDDKLLGVLLLGKLKDQLEPESAFSPSSDHAETE